MDKETVDRARREADESYAIFKRLKQQFHEAEDDYLKKYRRFQAFDRELAMTDGRYKVIPPKQKAPIKEVSLTLEQIQNIANILSIELEDSSDEGKEMEKVD
jgi:hypothetical protein